MDPAKLKVVDLRQELQKRGLDTKGNKAVLVKRLQDALDKEPSTDSGNASPINDPLADDTSHTEEQEAEEEEQQPQPEEAKRPIRERRSSRESRSLREPKTPKKELKPVKEEPPVKAEPKNEEVKVFPQKAETNICVKKEKEPVKEEKVTPKEEEKVNVKEESVPEVKQEVAEVKEEGVAEIKQEAKPTENVAKQEDNAANGEHQPEEVQESPEKKADEQEENGAEQMETETRGEKRKREEADSPGRPTKRREASPIKEDEPEIDPDKPQLSWFDSDLHLKIDKETFLSAKPMNDNCFGFFWAGARATHGISSGKICYEVKLTEEMAWEDPSKYMGERKDRGNKYRLDNRRDKKNEETSEENKKNDEENTEKADENSEESGENADGKPENDESGETQSENTEQADGENTEQADSENTKQADGEQENADNPEEKETDDKEEPKPEEAESSEKMETETEEKSEENKDQSEEKPKPDPIPTHYFRVGFSVLGASLQLGEDKYSYGYESTGKFITDKQFSDYGIAFGAGDVVGAYLNIDAENVTITYAVNGVLQPTALNVPRSELPQENFVLFPHVLCRNYAYEMNFGSRPEPWFAQPEELKDYVFLQSAEEKVAGPSRPATRSECEVILMVGLPGSGKTHWVKNHIESSPVEKAYNVIGNKSILERMTVDGEPLKSRFTGSWKVLVDRIQKILNTLTDLAAQRRRNYIIDQTNVFPNAQRRKLRPFDGFQRKAVVVVCGEEELERRRASHENDYGKSVPESTMLDLKAQMELPTKCEWLDELIFPDLNEEEAKKKVKEFNEDANKKGYFRRWHNQPGERRNFRGGYNRDRGYGGWRYDRHGRYQGGWARPAGGGWGRDKRDARGPPLPRAGGRDAWRPAPYRAPVRPQERNVRPRDNRNSSGTGGYGWGGRSQEGGSGRSANSWQSGGGSWGSGGGGGWNAQMYGAHGYGAWNQQAWKYGGGQAGGYNAQSGTYGSGAQGSNYGSYGQGSGQSAAGYGGQNWNYYGQYSQQAQGWGSQQKRN